MTKMNYQLIDVDPQFWCEIAKVIRLPAFKNVTALKISIRAESYRIQLNAITTFSELAVFEEWAKNEEKFLPLNQNAWRAGRCNDRPELMGFNLFRAAKEQEINFLAKSIARQPARTK